MSFDEKRGRADRTDEVGAPCDGPFGETIEKQSQVNVVGAQGTPSFQPQLLEAYDGLGYEFIRLHVPAATDQKGRSIGKVPYKGWRTAPALTVEEAKIHMGEGGNVGVRLRPQDLVVDVDPRNFPAGDDPLVRLADELKIDLTGYPTVVTGSGGLHIYMLKDPADDLRDTIEGYPGIEFKTVGRQVVAAGSAHPATCKTYQWDEDVLSVPLRDVRMAPPRLIEMARRPAVTNSVGAGERSPEQLAEMLEGLDPCQFREHERWLALMMACHDATAGEGRNEFIEWSTSDPVYANDAWIIGCRWDSLHADGPGKRVTEKTLFRALVDAGRSDLLPRPTTELADPDGTGGSAQSLADEYVWVVDAERFVRRSDTKMFSAQQFKSFMAGEWAEGDVLNAIWKDRLPIRKLESLVYLPDQSEFVGSASGSQRYNIWRDCRVEPVPGDVSVFTEHMEHLFPDVVERTHVLDFLSLLVRKPFVKTNFALLVRGRPGTGKSWLGSLVGAMVGEPNVSRPSNAVVGEKYTGWQKGCQLVVIEELMALGRREVANTLKPVITDDWLTIREQYGRPYSLPNNLNLMCFTNHADALPIEAGDRRWLVVFSEAEKRDEAYYNRLFHFLAGPGPAAVAHFLVNREVALNPKGVAPLTRGKAEMRRLSLGEAEQYLATRLDEREYPFDFDLVSLDELIDCLPSRVATTGRGNLQTRLAEWLSTEVGAQKHGRLTKRDGSGRTSAHLWSIVDHDHWDRMGASARATALATARSSPD